MDPRTGVVSSLETDHQRIGAARLARSAAPPTPALPAAPAAPVGLVRLAAIAIANETQKGLLLIWDRRLNTLSQLAMLAFIFIGIGFVGGDGRFDATRLAPMLLGYLLWVYARVVIFSVSADLVAEAQTGTLEQLYLSPVPPPLLLLGRLIALLVSTTLMVGLLGLTLVLLVGVPIPWRPEGLPVLALTLVGLFGFGLALSGLTLIVKQVAAFADLLQNLILFLNGALVAIDRFPDWLSAVARALPTTQGIGLLRRVVLEGQTLPAAWSEGTLLGLLLQSAAYLVGGWLVYQWCERVARRQGSLGQY